MIDLKLFLFFLVILEVTKIVPADDDVGGQTRIVGGSEAAQGSYPYMVSLQKYSESNFLWMHFPKYTHFCGGVLVTATSVLTAAHCVVKITDRSKISMYAGVTNLLDTSGQRKAVDSFVVYPNFSPSNISSYDIAIAKTGSNMGFTLGLKVATIAINTNYVSELKCFIAGWGSVVMMRWLPDYLYDHIAFPNDLQHAAVTTINNTRCNKEWPDILITNYQICTKERAEKGDCFGDSGGPLICNAQLAGIISAGPATCANGKPDIYTRLSTLNGWINNNWG